MEKDMHQQLLSLKSSLAAELASFESQLESIRKAVGERRDKISAIDTLLGTPEPTAGKSVPVEDLVDDLMEKAFTPAKAYWRPLLETLSELGGAGQRKKVIKLVGEKMKQILTPADHMNLQQSNEIRWENRVAWQAHYMRRDGFISKKSRRGIWEITDAGRKWLDDNS